MTETSLGRNLREDERTVIETNRYQGQAIREDQVCRCSSWDLSES